MTDTPPATPETSVTLPQGETQNPSSFELKAPPVSSENLRAAGNLDEGLSSGKDPEELMREFVQEENKGNDSDTAAIPNSSEKKPDQGQPSEKTPKEKFQEAIQQHQEKHGLQAANLESDPRYAQIKDQLMAQWLQNNPEPGQGKQELTDKEKDQWRDWVNRKLAFQDTLGQRARQIFEQHYREDFNKYQRYEVYQSLEEDPRFQSLLEAQRRRFTQIAEHSGNAQAINQAEAEAKKMFAQMYPEVNKIYAIKDERLQNNNKVETSSLDARDYFAIGKFQKTAELIDPDKTHNWSLVRNPGVFIKSEFGTIVVGETYNAEAMSTNKFGILIAERDVDGKASSVFLEHLNQSQRIDLMYAIHLIAPCLPDKQRHEFLRKIIQTNEHLREAPFISEIITRMALELLPNHQNSQKNSEFDFVIELPPVNGKRPTQEQQKTFVEFARIVASKMPKDKFDENLQKFLDNLPFTTDPYGKNFSTIFFEMTQWVLDVREDTQRKYNILKMEEPDQYPIEDQITTEIHSLSQLESILASLPIEEMPDIRNRVRGNERPEIVSLNNIVGGNGITRWDKISTSEGRGLSHVYELIYKLKQREVSVTGKGGKEPIRLIKIGDKFFVESDGRHRVAALKAMGVDKIPAMVTYIK